MVSGNINRDDSDVIACNILRPRPDFAAERSTKPVRRKRLEQDTFDSLRAELFAVLVGFQHAIGIEQEAIAVPNGEVLRRLTRKRHDAENQAVLYNVMN